MHPFTVRFIAFVTLIAFVLLSVNAKSFQSESTPKVPVPAKPQPAEPSPTDPALTLPPEASEGNWQLHFAPGDFRLYIDPETGVDYWYFTYKVVNRTGQDRWWAPRFELMDDQGRIRRSGKDISPITMKRIEALIGNQLIQDQYQILGEIRQGDPNAKEGFVVWNALGAMSTELNLFIRGMSSEIKKVPNPSKGGIDITMHKTMKMDFRIAGDAMARGSIPVPCEQTEWILR